MKSSGQHSGEYLYFDNAATTFPKPEEVVGAVTRFMTGVGGNPGRSGHALAIESGEIVFTAREEIARLFGAESPLRVIFCPNATEALNLAIQGILSGGGHAVTTAMEHNSSIRPLSELERSGAISLTVVSCSKNGLLDMDELARNLRPDTKLVVINHASNVFGTAQPLEDIAEVCSGKGVVLLADCAQSAGIMPLDIEKSGVDILTFSGHKGMYGPTGTGGLILSKRFDHGRMRPLVYGGTGSGSDSVYQPDFLPDRYESGTLNAAGIAGLCAGVRYILSLQNGVAGIHLHKKGLVRRFVSAAEKRVRGFIRYVPADLNETGVVSFNIEGMDPSDVALRLGDNYGILCRAGLHCAPLAHRSLNTFPRGTVRFSFGIFNTTEHIDRAVEALEEISGAGRAG